MDIFVLLQKHFCIGHHFDKKKLSHQFVREIKERGLGYVKHLYESLLNDSNLLRHFMECVDTGHSNMVQHKNRKVIWKYLLTKTCHAGIGVISGGGILLLLFLDKKLPLWHILFGNIQEFSFLGFPFWLVDINIQNNCPHDRVISFIFHDNHPCI